MVEWRRWFWRSLKTKRMVKMNDENNNKVSKDVPTQDEAPVINKRAATGRFSVANESRHYRCAEVDRDPAPPPPKQ